MTAILRCMVLGVLISVAIVTPAYARSPGASSLAREQILIVPVALQASPAQQTVPKNTATVVSVALVQPPGAGTAPIPADALVFAQLRGAAFGSAVVLTARPNEPIPIPPLALTGLYILENIRLVSGGRTLLPAVPASVTVAVLHKGLVSQVTSRTPTA